MIKQVRSYASVLDYDDEEALSAAVREASLSSPDSSSVGSCTASSLDGEVKRLSTLRSYMILEAEEEESFHRVVADVRKKYDVAWAGLSFVDLGRQWFLSLEGEGIDCRESSRRDAFCSHTIKQEDGLFVVPDTLKDDRFRDNAFVTSELAVRFYAGSALVSPEGCRLGALCIFDNKARPQGLTETEQDDLLATAESVVRQLVQRREKLSRAREAGSSPKRERTFSRVDSPSTLHKAIDMESKKQRRSESVKIQRPQAIIVKEVKEAELPDPKSTNVDPDKYLAQLTKALWGADIKVKPALDLKDFFEEITEEQMAAYNMEIVSAARENNVDKLKALCEERGRDCLDCFNRFGEGLLNMACRRGFKEMAKFLLSEVHLSVRVRDDYGRTPCHDACWHPEPQLEICGWILERDPSLFLVADKRGFTPFQYARPNDWPVWRKFLFDNRDLLSPLAEPQVVAKFA